MRAAASVLRQTMREDDRKRHELLRLAARETEHHALIAGAERFELVASALMLSLFHLERPVHAQGDVSGLFVDGDRDAARVGIKPESRAV